MATIKDVAAAAQVSPTTVSLIINGRGEEMRISKSTVERVNKVMLDMGFQPNVSARRLRTDVIAKPVIGFYWSMDYRSDMLGAFLSNMQNVILDMRYSCDLILQTYMSNRLKDNASSILKNNLNGVIVGAASEKDLEFLENITPQMPIVLINRESEKYSTVGVDNQKMGRQAAGLLKQKGHKRVAIIMAERAYMAATKRMSAFIEACRQLDIETSPQWTMTGRNSVEGGVVAGEAYCTMHNPPTAIFCEIDSMAQGAMYTLHQHKIRIPQDVELLTICTQSEAYMEYHIPSISTVSIPSEKMAMSATSLLIGRMASGDLSPSHIVLNPTIHLRESFNF